MELILSTVVGDRWKLILRYCFRFLYLKWVRVCDNDFSMTVACTSTSPFCSNGRPTSVKSCDPQRRTFSSLSWSPFVGSQCPSSIITSPCVTLNCLPNSWTIANNRPVSLLLIWLLTFSIGFFPSFRFTNSSSFDVVSLLNAVNVDDMLHFWSKSKKIIKKNLF